MTILFSFQVYTLCGSFCKQLSSPQLDTELAEQVSHTDVTIFNRLTMIVISSRLHLIHSDLLVLKQFNQLHGKMSVLYVLVIMLMLRRAQFISQCSETSLLRGDMAAG